MLKKKVMTEKRAFQELRKIGFKIVKAYKNVKYIENLDGDILQWTAKEIIEIAKSYEDL